MILPIYCEPNPVLHQETEPITEITDEIRELAANMRETMRKAQGIGLAAPQIGKLISLLVVEMDDPEDPEASFPYLALINPRVTWKSKRMVNIVEGCLSIPGKEGSVQRPDRVRVKAKNLDGDTVEIDTDGMLARVLQHEIDHLHGILFTEYIPKKQLKERKIVDYPRL
ncbi:peptide deformylase [Patescibacteria group bacterium]|nr:peptide deformylase [Patescibacteria group bacterium]